MKCVQSGTDCCCVYHQTQQSLQQSSAALIELCNSACELHVVCVWLTNSVWCRLISHPVLSRGFSGSSLLFTRQTIAARRTIKEQCKHFKVATSPVVPNNLWSHPQALYDAASSGASPPPPSPPPPPPPAGAADLSDAACANNPTCYYTMEWDKKLEYLFIYHFFGLLWTNQFIVGFGYASKQALIMILSLQSSLLLIS